MRNISLLLMLCVLFVTSCQKDLPQNDSQKLLSTFVTEEMAISIVNEYLEQEQPLTKSGEKKTISKVYTTLNNNTKTSDEESPFVYIVNFSDNEGYILVAGDTRVPPILAAIDKGSLTPTDTIKNEGAAAMLSMIDLYYRMNIGMPVKKSDGSYDLPTGITNDGRFIYPLMTLGEGDGGEGGGDDDTENPTDPPAPGLPVITYEYDCYFQSIRGTQIGCNWGQDTIPYNLYTNTSLGNHLPCGCAATAVAQIMYFWGANTTYDNYYFNWDVMRNHTSRFNPYPGAYAMIGNLMVKLGNSENLDMTYGVNESVAYPENVSRTFENFGFSYGGELIDYDYNTIYTYVSVRPIFISGH